MKHPDYKYTHISLFYFIFFCLFSTVAGYAQHKLRAYEVYIDSYSHIAVKNMKDHHIPASITLAQALLESGAGQSDLARRSNNHFGIKCGSSWRGRRVYAADDLPNDCFRAYRSVKDSYEDHASFLSNRARYRHLFSLSITDYKGWARGLQKSGYATNRAYANTLIKIIEDYKLYRYDDGRYHKRMSRRERQAKRNAEIARATWTHQPYITHGLVYVIAVEGDTFASIAHEFGFNVNKLLKYNEVTEDYPLNSGDIVYFQKKKTRADSPYTQHVVQVGESMYSIAQRYGMKLRNLYRLNKKDYEYIPEEGDVLKLR